LARALALDAPVPPRVRARALNSVAGLAVIQGDLTQAAAAAEEATEDADATLLADDDRARFTAVVPGRRRFAPGEIVELGVAADAVHLFDPATGDALR
jgi:hypothetical protein